MMESSELIEILPEPEIIDLCEPLSSDMMSPSSKIDAMLPEPAAEEIKGGLLPEEMVETCIGQTEMFRMMIDDMLPESAAVENEDGLLPSTQEMVETYIVPTEMFRMMPLSMNGTETWPIISESTEVFTIQSGIDGIEVVPKATFETSSDWHVALSTTFETC